MGRAAAPGYCRDPAPPLCCRSCCGAVPPAGGGAASLRLSLPSSLAAAASCRPSACCRLYAANCSSLWVRTASTPAHAREGGLRFVGARSRSRLDSLNHAPDPAQLSAAPAPHPHLPPHSARRQPQHRPPAASSWVCGAAPPPLRASTPLRALPPAPPAPRARVNRRRHSHTLCSHGALSLVGRARQGAGGCSAGQRRPHLGVHARARAGVAAAGRRGGDPGARGAPNVRQGVVGGGKQEGARCGVGAGALAQRAARQGAGQGWWAASGGRRVEGRAGIMDARSASFTARLVQRPADGGRGQQGSRMGRPWGCPQQRSGTHSGTHKAQNRTHSLRSAPANSSCPMSRPNSSS
jgi:hypothetical protein